MRLPEHCHFILDEFANTGKIPTFCEKLSTIRKYRINCSIIVQSPDQLKNMYEKEYNVIIDNCNIKLFLGTNSPETAKWVSDTLGNKTIITRSENWNNGGQGGGSEGFSQDKQELMSPDKVLSIKDYECIAMVYGGNNIYEQKYEISNHPNYKEAMKYKGKFVAERKEREKDTRDKAALFASSSIPLDESQRDESKTHSKQEDKEGRNNSRNYDSSKNLQEDEDERKTYDFSDDIFGDMEEVHASQKITNTRNVANAKRDLKQDGKPVIGKDADLEKLTRITESAGITNTDSVEDMKRKLEESSCITDYADDDFAFDSNNID